MGELLKYGGSGMVDLLEQLFSVIWQEEIVPMILFGVMVYGINCGTWVYRGGCGV